MEPTEAFEAHDKALTAVTGDAPRLVRVVDTDAHEGPVYVAAEDALYFTISAPGTIRCLALDGERFPLEPERVTAVRAAGVSMANGMTLDLEGRLLVCEQGTPTDPARIGRIDLATRVHETVVDAWRGLPLNSPNDVVVKSDGTVWFTDPSYGHLQGFRPEPRVGDFVYRYDPGTGHLTVVADSFDKPNGLAFSPDESVLYVTDSGANQEPGTTDGALAHWGGDPRRLRPNLVIGGVEGLVEFDWPRHAIRVGDAAVVGLHSRRARCVMTTFTPTRSNRTRGSCATSSAATAANWPSTPG